MLNQPPTDLSHKSLTWQDVPQLDPEAQFVKLPDGRTLVSHKGGFSIRAACNFSDLKRVLAAVDGRRTVAEIARLLSPFFFRDELFRFLDHLVGDVLHLDQGPEIQSEPGEQVAQMQEKGSGYSVLLVGNGWLANQIGKGLSQASDLRIETLKLNGDFGNPILDTFPHLAPRKTRTKRGPSNPVSWNHLVNHVRGSIDLEPYCKGRNLLVFALDRGSLSQWFWLQSVCMELGLPSLFLVPFQGRIRWHFFLAPQITGCLACSYLRSLRPLFLEPATLIAALGAMRSSFPGTQDTSAVSGILAEMIRMFQSPSLGLTHVLDFAYGGGRREVLAKPVTGCPLCSDSVKNDKPETASAGPVTNLRLAAWRKLTRWQKPSLRPGSTHHPPIQRIAILGGGSAGYLTALALNRKYPNLTVDLIESNKVPVIGVGEATTPLMPQFLHGDLGFDVVDFYHQVKPTFKLGIQFNWGRSEGFAYPFGPNRVRESLLFGADLSHSSLNGRLMKVGRLPLLEGPKDTWECRFGSHTAYHLDNQRFVAYLRQVAMARRIPVVDKLVTRTKTCAEGDAIEYLETEDGTRLTYDFYVDCTGFRSMLMAGSLGSPFVDYGASLFTDRAWVGSVPNVKQSRPFTLADTMGSGWCWNVPQPGEDHVGYVFCSRHCDDERALLELREKYPTAQGFRLLTFRSGRRRHFFKGNVAAMGNAYGFVEPLESTALHMLIRQIGILLKVIPFKVKDREKYRDINNQVGDYWDYLCWFLACHYRFNGKLDTRFWRQCRAEADVDRHRELIDHFQREGLLSATRSNFPYPDPLWGAEGVDVVLAGQGVSTPKAKLGSLQPGWRQTVKEWRNLAGQGVSQDRALKLFESKANLLPEFARAFADVGPAFIHL